MSGTAGQGILAVQLNAGGAIAGHGYSRLALVGGVDVDILQGDIGGAILLRFDGDGVLRSGFAVVVRDDRFARVLLIVDGSTLRDVVAVRFGNDADAAILHVIRACKCCGGAGRHHCQKRGGGKHPQGQTIGSFLHKNTPSFMLQEICILPCIQRTARHPRSRKRVDRPCTAQIIAR